MDEAPLWVKHVAHHYALEEPASCTTTGPRGAHGQGDIALNSLGRCYGGRPGLSLGN